MTSARDRPLLSVEMAGLEALARARTGRSVIDIVRQVFDGDVTLFGIDHAADSLIEILPGSGDAETVELAGELRTALLRAETYRRGDTVWVPVPERQATVYVVRVNAAPDEHRISPAIGLLLRDHRFRFEALERDRRRSQMAVAAELQWDVLPVRADVVGDYQIASVLAPAYEVAGDVFDFAYSEGALWAYSFDGMGSGMAATLTSVLALSAVRNARRRGEPLDEQMRLASAILHEQYQGDRFVTGVAVQITDDAVNFVNAGHEPARTVTDGNVRQIELVAELPLGVVDEPGYSVQTIDPLDVGDGLVLLSDGPAGVTSPDGEQFGSKRVDEAISARWSETPLLTAHDFIGDVLSFVGEQQLSDDLTAVMIRRDRSHEVGG